MSEERPTTSDEAILARLRGLPSVDRLTTAVARAELESRRAELLAGATDDVDLVGRARGRLTPRLRRVLNATGVVVHTNLGRAPLAVEAHAAVARTATGADALAAALRAGDPALVGRVHAGELLLEPRTLTDEEARWAAQLVVAACA